MRWIQIEKSRDLLMKIRTILHRLLHGRMAFKEEIDRSRGDTGLFGTGIDVLLKKLSHEIRNVWEDEVHPKKRIQMENKQKGNAQSHISIVVTRTIMECRH